jgi:N-acetylmuramoyl-L-alanine amidase
MDEFRAIYHADPGDAHAARAVVQVAELLAEQGREFGDTKSLRDAAGQYEFVAKAYPVGTVAPEALVSALDLLGPDGVGDAVEAKKVRAELVREYPKYARVKAETRGDKTVVKTGRPDEVAKETSVVAKPGSENPDPGHPGVGARESSGVGRTAVAGSPTHHDETVMNGAPAGRTDSSETAVVHVAPVVREEAGTGRVIPEVAEKGPSGPPAEVTGIRHWSTSSYTRVAIDLAVDPKEDVKYEAARVENPDRIFFDLQHAKLAPQLAGKSFTVTDDGFLTKIRAAQFSDDVTRVVLDVHEVTEYSAFLLPNPYRLIIDIHGKAGAPNKEDVAADRAQAESAGAKPDETVASASAGTSSAVTAPAVTEAPVGKAGRGGVEVSSLPPMPVTDGSAGFGLPARSSDTAKAGTTVARPRVVISSKPTASKPVPNTVTKSSSDTGTEVAAVSLQPGKVEATRRPTSQPISSRSSEKSSEQLAVNSEQAGGGEHYVPRSKRAVVGSADEGGVVPPTSQSLDAGHSASAAVPAAPAPAEAAPPMADGGTSLTRALGLKIGRIVIDAGHGGHDSGTLGAGGIEEKDVVLDVALRLGKLLHDRLGAEIVYTRADDTFIPLETRTAIANKAQADLFISVHANSSQDASARGVEVYYLNFTSDPEAMMVASRENAVSTESVHELSDLVKKIALKDKIEESKELASDVDTSLYAGLRKGNEGLKDRGVKKAPFVVLIGANMPSILAEISFVTNPDDAEKLETPEYRERVAESLYKGIARYAAGINGQGPVKPKGRSTETAER